MRPANEPSLAALTGKAIQLLDAGKRNHGKGKGSGKRADGFFLQVEGASIDK